MSPQNPNDSTPAADGHWMHLSAEQWAIQQFARVDLGDKRRNLRAVRVAAAMAERPEASIPQQMGGDAAAIKAAYRFFSRSDLVTFDSLSAEHRRQTRQQMRHLSRVLLIGDDTEINFTHHPANRGMELIGDGKGRGLSLHSVLAVDEEKGLLGLPHQNLFYRQKVEKGETRTQRVQRDRESLVWSTAVTDLGRAPEGCQFIHINDRASDNWPFYESCRKNEVDWISRAAQDRCAALDHQATQKTGTLKVLIRTGEALGGMTLKVRGNQARSARSAKLLVWASAVTIFPSWLNRHGAPIRMWAVRVWEVDAPEGAEPIEWILLTNLPVRTLEEALQIALWYSWRWLIEEYHKCLKSGCRVEERQLQEGDRLEALLGILTIVAARLLALKQQVQQRPQSRAMDHVEELTVKVLVAKRKLKKHVGVLTLHEFWREVAKLGGFLGRKGDGEPGWQTLWRGWRELQLLVEGVSLARSLK